MSKTNELLTQIYTTKLRLKSALGTSSDDICSYPTLIYNFFVNIWNNNYPTGYDNGYNEAYQVIAGTAPTQEHTVIERRTLKEYTSNIPTVVDDRDRAFILNIESIMIQVKESRLEMKDELFTTSDDFTIYPDLLNYLILHADVFERMGYDDGWAEACENLSTNRPSSPTISFSDNTITLSGSGTIMYSLNGDEYSTYSTPIDIDEDTYIIAYSVVNDIPSESVSSWCKYEDDTPIPAPLSPNIYFSNNTITISSTEVGGIIKYSFDGENYSTYNSPISITEDKTVYAYVVKDGVSSDVASRFCEYNSSGGGQGGGGSEEDNVPAPTIIFSNNTITIYNNAGGGKTYYYFTPSTISEYTSSISISSSVTVYAYTIKNNVMSNTVSQYCEYNAQGGGGGTVTVASPSIGFSNNTITITNNEAGASVYYSFDGVTYSAYTVPISISSTVTVYAYASKNGVNSSVVNRNCTYDGPIYVPSAPVIIFSDNIITITTDESGAVIKYSYDGVNYSTYTSPIVISEVTHVYAKVTKNGVDSSVVDRICDPEHEYDNDYLTIRMLENGNIAWVNKIDSQFEAEDIEYSKNNGTWHTLHANTVGISVERGDVIRFKYYNSSSWSVSGKFSISSLFDVEGNVLSLVNGDTGTRTRINCIQLFRGTSVHSAQNLILPAPQNNAMCYLQMFMNCTSLIDTPTLHDTVTPRCYENMFYGCTSLTTAPALPATSLATNCYTRMFRDCTSLTTAPALPATVLGSGCYYAMFWGCTSLVNAPSILPAITLMSNCYDSMFYGCTSLTTAPEIPETNPLNSHTECLIDMFGGCTRLNYVKCLIKPAERDYNQFAHWLTNVAVTGTFVKHPDAVWSAGPYGYSGIPSGWTVQDAVV